MQCCCTPLLCYCRCHQAAQLLVCYYFYCIILASGPLIHNTILCYAAADVDLPL
jgi:hypothetical protein